MEPIAYSLPSGGELSKNLVLRISSGVTKVCVGVYTEYQVWSQVQQRTPLITLHLVRSANGAESFNLSRLVLNFSLLDDLTLTTVLCLQYEQTTVV